jgi:hypothetical protein
MKASERCGWFLLLLLANSGRFAQAAADCPVITKGPSNFVAYYCDFVTFQAEATGRPPLRYQWYRDGSPISGATNGTYATGRPSGAFQGAYFVTVQNDGCGPVTSRVASLTVLGDVIPPTVIRASVLPDRTRILLSFYPCPLDPGTTGDPSNYEFTGGIVLSNIAIIQETNLLLTTSLLASTTHYNLRLWYLQNIEGNTIYPNPMDVSLWSPPLRISLTRSNNNAHLSWPAGGILQRSMQPTGQWTDITLPSNSAALNGTGFYRVRFP